MELALKLISAPKSENYIIGRDKRSTGIKMKF